MAKEYESLIFWIPEIPDVNFSQFQAVGGGDVRKAIWRACEHILRTLSNMRDVSAEILLIYDPTKRSRNQTAALATSWFLRMISPKNLRFV